MNLQEAAAHANELADAGDERAVADLRREWDDELEGFARDRDYRNRAVAYRAIGQFRYRQKLELLQRGLEDESPACRGSALVSLELLSRDHPAPVNQARRTLQDMATDDENEAVRRLAIMCLKNGSGQRESILILEGLADDDEQSRELRDAAKKVAALLTKKSRAK